MCCGLATSTIAIRREACSDAAINAWRNWPATPVNPAGHWPRLTRDELYGFLSHLDKEEFQSDRSFYLEGWNGSGRFTFDRVMRGTVECESVVISVLGGIQPAKLQQYVSSAMNGGHGDDGLMQRFQLAVYPDVSNEFRNVDRWPNTEHKQRARDVYQRLVNLDVSEAEAEESNPQRFVRFGVDAQATFDEWRVGIEHRLRNEGLPPHMESHLAKYRSLVPSLALLLEVADNGVRTVTQHSLKIAIKWAEYLECHANRIYGSNQIGPARNAVAILGWIKAGDLESGFTVRDVYRKGRDGITDKATAVAAIEVLEDHGYVRQQQIEKSRGIGKASAPYIVNPFFFTQTPE